MIKKKKYVKNFIKGGITEAMQEDLFNSSVLVMGAGALGSGVIMNLAAMGVGKIKLIDSDVIELDNLNCQFIHKENNVGRSKVISAKDWIADFNSDIKVELDKVRLNEFNYFNTMQGYDIIVDCFNSNVSSHILNEIALRHNKILIYGSVKAFCGQVTTIVPKKTGCLNCVIKKPPMFTRETDEEELAKLSSVVNIVSSVQATEVLKIITGAGTPLLNRLLTFDAVQNDYRILNYSRNITCEVCSQFLREGLNQDINYLK